MDPESKKLQTRIIEGMICSRAIAPGGHPILAAAHEKAHDVLIAHEMREVFRQLESDLRAALAWIDAVPHDVVLPAMPGFDRDDVDSNLAAAAPFLED